MLVRLAARVSLLCVLPVLLVGCGPSSPREGILGTWQNGIGDKKKTMTFWENGAWSYESGKTKYTGRFKFLAEKEVEMTVDLSSEYVPIVWTRTISFANRDQMYTTEGDHARRTTWKRIEP